MRTIAPVWSIFLGVMGLWVSSAVADNLSDSERHRLSRDELVCRIFSHRESIDLQGTPLVDHPHVSKSDLLELFGIPVAVSGSDWETDGLHWENRYIEVEFESSKLTGVEKRDVRDDSRIIFFKELTLSNSEFLLSGEEITIGSTRRDIVNALGIDPLSGGGKVYSVADNPEKATITYSVKFKEPDWNDINCRVTFKLTDSRVKSIRWRFLQIKYAQKTDDLTSIENWAVQGRHNTIGYNDNLRDDGVSKLDQIDLVITVVNDAEDDGIYTTGNEIEFHSRTKMTVWKFFRLLKTVLAKNGIIDINLPPYLPERHVAEVQSVPLPLLIENFQLIYPDIRFIEDDFGLTVNRVTD